MVNCFNHNCDDMCRSLIVCPEKEVWLKRLKFKLNQIFRNYNHGTTDTQQQDISTVEKRMKFIFKKKKCFYNVVTRFYGRFLYFY